MTWIFRVTLNAAKSCTIQDMQAIILIKNTMHGMRIDKSEIETLLNNNKLQNLLHHVMLLRALS